MPPTLAAARMITSGLARATHCRTASCSRRSTSRRSTLRISTSSLARRRRIAEPTMPRWPATQIRRLFPECAEGLSMLQSSDPAAFLHHDQVAGDHFRDELWKSDGVLPAKFLERLAWIAEKEIDLRRTEIARIDLDEGPAALFVETALLDSGAFPADADAGFGEGAFDEFAHRVGFPRRQDIIVRLGLLQNAPHSLDVIACVAPIPLGIEVAQKELVLKAQMDRRDRAGDFSRDEGLGPGWTFMVEQDAVRSVHSIGFAVIDGDPIGVELRGGVRRARIEGRCLVLRNRLHLPIKLGCRSLIEAGFLGKAQDADRFEKAKRANGVGILRIFRRLETHLDVALRGEVVNFVGLDLLDNANEVGRIGEVAIMQQKVHAGLVRVMIQMIDTAGIDQRRS